MNTVFREAMPHVSHCFTSYIIIHLNDFWPRYFGTGSRKNTCGEQLY